MSAPDLVLDAETLLVAMPVRFGLPAVASDRRRCGRCFADVWVSKRATPFGGRVVCVVCAMALVKPGDMVTPAAWVLADLADIEA